MSSRNGKNQPQLSPANVGHVAEAQSKADNRKGQREQERDSVVRELRSLCAFALRCTFFAVPFCVFLRCCFAWPFAMYKTLHTSGRALSLLFFLSLPLTHHSLSCSLSFSVTHSLRAAAVLLMRHFFKLRPFPAPFLPSLSRSRFCCQPVATTTTTMECPSPCCCSCSCCFLGIAAFYAAK